MGSKIYFRDRIQAVRDKGYLHGINELKFPADIEKTLENELYKIGDGKIPSNIYLLAVFEHAYYEGKADRNDIISISIENRPRFDISVIRKAFELGRKWRRHSAIMLSKLDDEFVCFMINMTQNADPNWKWIESKRATVEYSWMAGFHFESELSFDKEAVIPESYVVACDRMRYIKYRFDREDELGGETPCDKALTAYSEAVGKLEKTGFNGLKNCLCCPELRKNLGELSDDITDNANCSIKCRTAADMISSLCDSENKELNEYYLVPYNEYYPLAEEM